MTRDTSHATADEMRALAATARLFGRLLVRELDAPLLAELREPGLAHALRDIGVRLPDASAEVSTGAGDAALLDALAAEYFEMFVSPTEGAPLVQSLHQGGVYEGPPAAGARRLAEAAGVTLDADAARGAPADHLGCLLQLWARVAQRSPSEAGTIANTYLAWAAGPLRLQASRRSGFYAELSAATADWIEEVAR